MPFIPQAELVGFLACFYKKNGKWTEWDAEGQKESEGEYLNDLKNGYWFEPEVPCYTAEGRYINAKREDNWTWWFDNRMVKSLSFSYKGTKTKDVFTNGQKWMSVSYKNGILDGVFTQWDQNGKKRDEGNYRNGKKSGSGCIGMKMEK